MVRIDHDLEDWWRDWDAAHSAIISFLQILLGYKQQLTESGCWNNIANSFPTQLAERLNIVYGI